MNDKIDIISALGLPTLPSHSPDSIAALMWAREVFQNHLKTTYEVKNPKGIDQLKAIKIGGVDQWLHIRGRNQDNPVLLYLHGGPGATMIGWMDATMRPWEDYFTVVHWDQRQAGKSYYPADDKNHPLTVNHFIEDAEEVIQYLQGHLKKEKVFLLGHSWGSILGMHMVKRHPDWLHAYIGIGQVVDWVEGEKAMHKRLLGHAKMNNNTQLVAKLEAMEPYPDPVNLGKSYVEYGGFLRIELGRIADGAYETNMRYLPIEDLIKMVNLDRTISPHLTLTDLSNSILGDEMALLRPSGGFTEDCLNQNLPKLLGSSFDVPIFFFTGAHDWHTPKVLSDKWFEQIEAPHKELVVFEESCHFVVNEEPGKVITALVTKVLPFAQNGCH